MLSEEGSIEGGDPREVRLGSHGPAAYNCSSPCNRIGDDEPDSCDVASDDTLSNEDGELLTANELIDDPPEEPTEEPS